jgi:hypothetical protein
MAGWDRGAHRAPNDADVSSILPKTSDCTDLNCDHSSRLRTGLVWRRRNSDHNRDWLDGFIVICSLHRVGYARSHADCIIGLSHRSVLVDKPATAFCDGDIDALYAPQLSQKIAAAPSAV